MCWSLPQMFVATILRITPWWHCRSPKASFGKSMFCTSTTPGLMYATPLLPDIKNEF
jgi:hypothetical protein